MRTRPDWRARLAPAQLRRIATGLAIGALGGWAADAAGVPLAWMTGALFACAFLSVAGVAMDVPLWVRTRFLVILGLFLGESFGGFGAGALLKWPVSIALALAYVPVAMWVVQRFYRRVGGQDRVTALLASVPGGITPVVMVAEQVGAQEGQVALSQALRIAIVVLSVPAVAFGLLGFSEPEVVEAAAVMSLADGAILILAGLAATWALDRAGIPVPFLIGPILASAALRGLGLIEGVLPEWLVDVALVVTGASIGARFTGTTWTAVGQLALLTIGGTALMMAVSGAFAALVSLALGIDYLAAFLAFAPGGVAEMTLIAIAIEADPAFVAIHHVARIMLIMLIVPSLGAMIRKRRKG